MTTDSLRSQDERAHTPTTDQWWNESWYFDAVTADGSVGLYCRLGLYPNQNRAWYWAAVARPGQPTVLVRDHDVALPRAGQLMIRNDGLWADHNIEEPMERWSLGLEAFAVALDDPADALGDEWGHRTPVGFDFEWESTGPPYRYPGVDRYEIPCHVHGELLVGDEVIDFDGRGERDHSWGVRDWWTFKWWWTTFHMDDRAVHGMRLDADGIDFSAGFDYGESPAFDTTFTIDEQLDHHGFLVSATALYNGESYRIEPVAHAPVRLDDPGPPLRTSHFMRSLARWTHLSSGAVGYGWYERNLPQ